MRRLAPLLLVVGAVAACGGSTSVDEALRERLEGLKLSVRSINCVDSGLEYAGEPVSRCQVNFGDPHLVPYCAALLDGDITTDREAPDMRCYPPEDEQRYRDAVVP